MAWGLLATINWIQCRHQVFLFVCLFVLWRFWYFKCISEILLMQSRSNFFGIQAWELHESKNQFYMILRTVGHGSRSVSWRFFWEPLVKNCPYIYIYIFIPYPLPMVLSLIFQRENHPTRVECFLFKASFIFHLSVDMCLMDWIIKPWRCWMKSVFF
jgi:hypothetical protein